MSQKYILQELERVQTELKAISLFDRLQDPTNYKRLNKEENKLLKQLSKSMK